WPTHLQSCIGDSSLWAGYRAGSRQCRVSIRDFGIRSQRRSLMRRVPCFRPIAEYRLLQLALLVEQDVRRLDLAMDDAVLQRVGDLGRQRCGLAERRLPS